MEMFDDSSLVKNNNCSKELKLIANLIDSTKKYTSVFKGML